MSSALLTHWEHDELLDHVSSRHDIWQQNEENTSIWLRIIDFNRPCCAIVIGDAAPGPLGLRQIDIHPLEWSAESCAEYLDELLGSWTEWGRRQSIQKLLNAEAGHDLETASALALAICMLDHEAIHADPEDAPPPIQEPLWPRGFLPPPDVARRDPYHVGIYDVKAGVPGQAGTLHLRIRGGQLACEISLPSPFGGHVGTLRGFVMPINGDLETATRRLRGEIDETTTDRDQSEFPEGLHELQETLGLAEASEPGRPREEGSPGDRDGDT